MKALSVRMPWAVAIMFGSKRIENRRWASRQLQPGERIAIHVSSTEASAEAFATVAERHPELRNIFEDPTYMGHVIGTVRVMGTIKHSDDEWFTGPVGWLLSEPEPCQPVFARGALGLWTFDERLLRPPSEGAYALPEEQWHELRQRREQ